MRMIMLVLVLVLAGCKRAIKPEMVERDVELPQNSRPWKISSARSAAPAGITKDAMILDLPPNDSVRGEELVLGANGWTCWPDDPKTAVNDPVCMDTGGREWTYAAQGRRAPRIASVGLIYRLQGSVEDGPNVAVILPNPGRNFVGLPTTTSPNTAWVKYAGTPWAYMVIPLARPNR